MKPLFKYTTVVSLVVIAASCKQTNSKESSTTPIVITDSLISSLRFATAQYTDEHNAIKLNGKITADETKTSKVYALVSGRVENLTVQLGDYVNKGQTLTILKSTEVAGFANDLQVAEQNVNLAKKTLQTTQDLFESKLATEQDFINAKITYNKALSELNRTKQVQSISGGNNAVYKVTAPISGFIIEKNITNKSEVRSDNSTSLFTIANLNTVWVTANVYEADMLNIQLNENVVVNTLANPAKNYGGKIDKIYNVLDPATRTMQVRVTMPNVNNELKPEMFVTVKVDIDSKTAVIAIPSAAIIMDDSKFYVIVKNAGKLKVQEVNVLKRTEETAYVTSLPVGTEVITQNQVYLYQELTSN